ncbi:amidohydrolase family protein [Methylobacterium sp. EM32]|uniref:amidohydrolase family protein n=1 Tax=Methylobacterium sp. EM32 TaxID=3163481 RepID=UPI0033AD99F5
MTADIDPTRIIAPPHLEVRLDWLASRQELPIEPAREIVDAHHHLWDRPQTSGRYLLPELLSDIAHSGHRITRTVYVQARSMYRVDGPEELRPVGEVAFASSVAREAASGPVQACAAIVGSADLTLGDAVAPVLDALAEAGEGRLRGIRMPVAWHDDPEVRSSIVLPPRGLMHDPRFRSGARRVAEAGLSLDVWAYHTQLDEIADLAASVPELLVVVNHAGGPVGTGRHAGRPDDVFAEWRAGMQRLSERPNIRMKLGGLAMQVSGFRFHEAALPPSSEELAQAWRPFVDTCIALFKPTRCLFESNFPVDKGMASYGCVWNAFKRLATGYSEAEKAALFAGTACDVYRISREAE